MNRKHVSPVCKHNHMFKIRAPPNELGILYCLSLTELNFLTAEPISKSYHCLEHGIIPNFGKNGMGSLNP